MDAQRLLRNMHDDLTDLGAAMRTRRFWQTLAAMFVGLTILGVGINGILIPSHMIGSGATGIAMALYYLLGRPSVGVIYWLLNIPILLAGYATLSLKYVVVALIGVFLSGATLQLTQNVRLHPSDPMMAAVLAGGLSGTGVGLYLRFGGSAGGLDTVAAVFRRRLGFPFGQTIFAINVLNILAGWWLSHSEQTAFYTAVAMFVHSRALERMQSGFSGRKTAFVVSAQADLLARQILRKLGRGCTFFHASGGMSQKQMRVIYTVVNFVDLARLKQLIYELDPHAFVAISDASEVIGNRFLRWEDEGFEKSRRRQRLERPAISLMAAAVGAPTNGASADATKV